MNEKNKVFMCIFVLLFLAGFIYVLIYNKCFAEVTRAQYDITYLTIKEFIAVPVAICFGTYVITTLCCRLSIINMVIKLQYFSLFIALIILALYIVGILSALVFQADFVAFFNINIRLYENSWIFVIPGILLAFGLYKNSNKKSRELK